MRATRAETNRNLTDQDLIAAIAQGDAEAFGALYDRHVDRVYRHCVRQLGTDQDADDITAIVFLETWRHRTGVRVVSGTALPWLLMTATNVARNHRRSVRRYRSALGRLPAQQAAPDHADEVVARVAFERAGLPLARALRSLSRLDQQVVSLCLIAGLSYDEAGAVLGLSRGAVRSRLMRSRRAIRNSLIEAGITAPDAYGKDDDELQR